MKYAISVVLFLSLSGCIMGPRLLKEQRYKYNEAIQESTAQQLLLNIVRLRYNDSPMFLNVGDVDAQFTLESSADASGTIKENVGAAPLNANSATVTTKSTFTDNPNIKLRPMQDADYAKLLEPLTYDEMLVLATRRQSRHLYEYLALVIQSYPYEAETVDAYRNTPDWMKFLQRLKEADEKGGILIETYREDKALLPSFAATAIAPEDVMKAKRAGLTFVGKGEDEYVLVEPTTEWTLTLPKFEYKEVDPSGRELDQPPVQVLEMRIDFAPSNAFESIDEERPKDKEPFKKAKYRSLVQMMYCLSLGVEVPSPHENERNGPPAERRILGFHVEFGALPPFDAFVSIKYRGYWFYIERSSTSSKKFFSVLTELFVERAGKPATTATTLSL